jgi:hypothetical protein
MALNLSWILSVLIRTGWETLSNGEQNATGIAFFYSGLFARVRRRENLIRRGWEEQRLFCRKTAKKCLILQHFLRFASR